MTIFTRIFQKKEYDKLLPNPQRQRQRKCQMSASEIMCILVLFHMSHYRTFKDYYLACVEQDLKEYFPNLVSYHRFLELKASVLVALTAYVLSKSGEKTNLYYLDSTSLKVCHNKRIYRNKVFKGIATRGKSSMGWFYGFKLHLVINHQGEIMSFCLTKANIDDRKPVEKLTKNLQGLAAADKGYLGKKLSEKLAGEQLKSICQIEHSRHRIPVNFLVNLVGGLAAYCLKPRKPSVKISKLEQTMDYAVMSS